jgi:hypothetical protein
MTIPSFEDWLALGVGLGYCTDQMCITHDWVVMTESEETRWLDGEEPCIHVVRLGSAEDWG